jgi:hypothetical protein
VLEETAGWLEGEDEEAEGEEDEQHEEVVDECVDDLHFVEYWLKYLIIRLSLIDSILNLQRYMFKNSDKRFEYDISPQLSEDADLFPPQHNYRQPYPVSTTTPVNRRSSFNQGAFDTRERHQISTQ